MTIQRRLRTAIESAASRAGILARFEDGARGSLSILTYHRVLSAQDCARSAFPSLVMPVEAFRAQMAWLARRYEVVTVGDGVARIRRGDGGDRPLCAVTFDDGYADNATIAGPILADLGIRATFFLVHEFVAEGRPLWFDAAARHGASRAEIERLKHVPSAERERALAALAGPSTGERAGPCDLPLTREQALALLRAGHEIGSHTLSHAVLTSVGDGELDREVGQSKRALEAWLGAPVHGFCYPNGDNDERVRDRVRAAGYAWACSTREGRNEGLPDPWQLARIDITPARVQDHSGAYSEIAFRSQISLMRLAWRGDRSGERR